MTIPELLPSKPMKMSLLFIGSDWPLRLAGLQTGIPFNIFYHLYLLSNIMHYFGRGEINCKAKYCQLWEFPHTNCGNFPLCTNQLQSEILSILGIVTHELWGFLIVSKSIILSILGLSTHEHGNFSFHLYQNRALVC